MGIFIDGVIADGGASQTIDIPADLHIDPNAVVIVNYNSWMAPGNRVDKAFNYPITIDNGNILCNAILQGCATFNHPVTFPNGITNLAFAFSMCEQFNYPITIPDSVTNCRRMFQSCDNFNQPINIPDSVTNCEGMFAYCRNFNQQVIVPDSVNQNCAYMFAGCNVLNQYVVFPNNCKNYYHMFNSCRNFDISVYTNFTGINSPTANCDGMFYECQLGVLYERNISIDCNDANFMFYHYGHESNPLTNGYIILNSIFSINANTCVGMFGVTSPYAFYPVRIIDSQFYLNKKVSTCVNMFRTKPDASWNYYNNQHTNGTNFQNTNIYIYNNDCDLTSMFFYLHYNSSELHLYGLNYDTFTNPNAIFGCNSSRNIGPQSATWQRISSASGEVYQIDILWKRYTYSSQYSHWTNAYLHII